MNRRTLFSLAAALALAAAAPLLAVDTTIAKQAEPAAIDPLFSRTGPTQHIAEHIFDRLLQPDDKKVLAPGLAVSWRNLDDLTVEFKLRPNVKFHDGTPLTADDVLFSFQRAANVPNSPASYANDVADIAEATAPDPLTVRVVSKKPNPLLITQLSRIYIISRKAAGTATTQDFNSGKAAIGTGPYRFVEWVPGERLVLQKNETYWGDKPHFDRVITRFISNDATRVAALLSGSADMIDAVPPSDFATLARNAKVSLWPAPSPTLVYIHMDSDREQTPFATDKSGKVLPKNPLKDPRVRKALSMLIDRPTLVDRVLQGAGEPAGQMVPEGLLGFNPAIKAQAYDPAGARKLLAEAGYPNGFGLTLHSANDRYVFQAEVVQVLAQFFARGGIDIKVETMPSTVFMTRAGKQEFSFFLLGYGSSTGDAMSGLQQVLATYDSKANMGSNNRGRYSNKQFDEVVKKAAVEMDTDKREALLRQAAEIGFADAGIIPVYFEKVYYATRKGLKFVPSPGIPRTVAMGLMPDK